MMLREGAAVSYCGDVGVNRPAIGDTGQVLVTAGDSAHVMWTSGARVHQVDFVNVNDVAPARNARQASVASEMDDSLAFGPMVTVAVRDTYDEQGPDGLLTALNEAGHLAGLVDIADHALSAVTAQIRQDEAMASVLANLDEAEADQFLSMTALALMRESFGSPTDE